MILHLHFHSVVTDPEGSHLPVQRGKLFCVLKFLVKSKQDFSLYGI